MLAVRRTMSAGATLAWNSTEERYSTMALRSTFLILPAVAVLFSGCAMLSSSQESKLTCHIPRAVYPDNAKPLTRRVTVLVRALMTTSGEAQNVTVTTSSRNAAADRAAVDAMTHASCAQTGATANPFLLTQPFVFEPRRGE
ncbi:TonB family protein [Burkholderia vietnamiensis]|jgi:protein TonB|nr:TonB family protein [Burkholderia vietnamiensis]WHU92659.1 TonB family protein [Burkholderia vietnamiensis]